MAEINHLGHVAYWSGRVWITPPTAAKMLNISTRTLKDWRDRRYGPQAVYRMLWGFSWRYDLNDVSLFLIKSAP